MTLLNLYVDYSKVFRNGKKNWCKSHGVSFRAMNKAEKIKEQLSRSLNIEDWEDIEDEEEKEKENKSVRIRKALTAGFFMNAAKKDQVSDGGGASNSSFMTLIGGNRLSVHRARPCFTTFPRERTTSH